MSIINGNKYCNECNLIIGEQKSLEIRENGKVVAHVHNRFLGDCYQKYLNKQPGFGRIGRQYPR